MNILSSAHIIKYEFVSFNKEDISILKNRRNAKLRYIISTYIALLSLLGMGLVIGYMNAYAGLAGFDIVLINRVAPVFFSFLTILLTYFFYKFYRQVVHPLNKDLKSGSKQLIWFNTKKYAMPFFNRYYLYIPLTTRPQVEIGKEDFFMLPEDACMTLETGKNSEYILRINFNDTKIDFY